MKLLNYHPDELHDKEEMLFGLEAGMKLGHEIHLQKNCANIFLNFKESFLFDLPS
jgi:hypothetical protein